MTTTTVPTEPTEAVAWLETHRGTGEIRVSLRRRADSPTMTRRWLTEPLVKAAAPVQSPPGKEVREAVRALLDEADDRVWTTEYLTDRLAALLTPAGEGWRPIECAPTKERKEVLLIGLYRDGKTWSDVYHSWSQAPYSDDFAVHWARWPHAFPPTHWMPLLSPPSVQPEGDR